MSQQWSQVARSWLQLGSPLRPTLEDVGFYQDAIAGWCANHPGRAPRGLILGVTPELYGLDWPDAGLLRAVDRTTELIEHVWPGKREQVLNCEWRHAGLPKASSDIVLCDGGLHLLDYPDGQQQLAARLAEWLTPGGRVILRLFVPPAKAESPQQVLADLDAGRIRDLNCLKLRLGAAMMRSAEDGVLTHDIWQRLSDKAPSGWHPLADRLGWSLEHLAVIDAYRASTERYHFVTLQQAIALFTSAGAFDVAGVSFPGYEMGELCPTLVLTRG